MWQIVASFHKIKLYVMMIRWGASVRVTVVTRYLTKFRKSLLADFIIFSHIYIHKVNQMKSFLCRRYFCQLIFSEIFNNNLGGYTFTGFVPHHRNTD